MSATLGPWTLRGGVITGSYGQLPRWALTRHEYNDMTGKVGTGIVANAHQTFAYLSAEDDDALLMAAAPDLLQTLRECVTPPDSFLWSDPRRRLETINHIARATIALATDWKAAV